MKINRSILDYIVVKQVEMIWECPKDGRQKIAKPIYDMENVDRKRHGWNSWNNGKNGT